MNKSIKHLNTLYNNPFLLGHILYSFYASLNEKADGSVNKSILFSYLVFPLTLYPASQTYLKNSNRRSRLQILQEKHECLFGLSERIQNYKEITNLTIQHSCDIGVFSVDSSLGIIVKSDWPKQSVALPYVSQAAKKLANLFHGYDVPSVYRFLGVTEL